MAIALNEYIIISILCTVSPESDPRFQSIRLDKKLPSILFANRLVYFTLVSNTLHFRSWAWHAKKKYQRFWQTFTRSICAWTIRRCQEISHLKIFFCCPSSQNHSPGIKGSIIPQVKKLQTNTCLPTRKKNRMKSGTWARSSQFCMTDARNRPWWLFRRPLMERFAVSKRVRFNLILFTQPRVLLRLRLDVANQVKNFWQQLCAKEMQASNLYLNTHSKVFLRYFRD